MLIELGVLMVASALLCAVIGLDSVMGELEVVTCRGLVMMVIIPFH